MNAPIRRLSIVVAAALRRAARLHRRIQFVAGQVAAATARTTAAPCSPTTPASAARSSSAASRSRSRCRPRTSCKFAAHLPPGRALRPRHRLLLLHRTAPAAASRAPRTPCSPARSDKLFYRRVVDLLTGKQPSGASLELTINPKAQEAADEALGNQRGAVVALDPKTGAILAMVSHPQYDPTVLASHDLTTVAGGLEGS